MSTRPTDETLATLTAELDATRVQLAAHREGIRRAASPGDQLKRSFREHKALFFGSAVTLGLLLALLPSGEKKSQSSPQRRRKQAARDKERDEEPEVSSHPLLAAAGVTVMKMIWDTAKPAIIRWVKEKVMERSRSGSTRKPLLAERREADDLMK